MSIANCGKLLCLDTAKNRGYKEIMNKLTLKQKKFVEVTAQTLNPTEGARQAYNLGSRGNKDKEAMTKTATVIASENIAKPYVKKALAEIMEEQGVNDTLVTSILKRNIKQNKNLPASNQVADMYFKLNGKYAPEKRVNLNINQMNIDNKIKELQDELQQLQQEG